MAVPIYLGGEETRALLDQTMVLRVVERALIDLSNGRVINGTKGGFTLADDNGQRHMGAVSGCDLSANIAGVKWFAACDENSRRGLPRVPATIVLCDAVTGLLIGIIDATHLTSVRTAALALCAIRPCIPQRLGKATVVGFGPIGQIVVEYLANHINVEEIVVASRSAAKNGVETKAPRAGTRLSFERDFERAVRNADLIVTATGLGQDAPLIHADWVQRGATVCGLGSYQEIDTRIALGADRIYVDNWEACQKRGNLAPAIKSGKVSHETVSGEVADVVAGKLPGRLREGETVLIVLVGIGALDVAIGADVLSEARLRGVGIPLG